MAADTERTVVLKFVTESADAERKTERLKGSVAGLATHFRGLQGRLSGMTSSFAMMGAGALGVSLGMGLLTRNIIGANVELDRIQRRITGAILTSQKWKDGVSPTLRYKASVAETAKAMKDFGEAGDKLVVGGEEIGATFATLTSQLTRYGVGIDQQKKVAIGAAAAAKITGTSAEQAGFVLARMLRGIPPRGTDPISGMFFNSQKEIKAFLKLAPEERMKLIVGKLEGMRQQAEAMPKSFEDVVKLTKSFITDQIRDIGRPSVEFIAKKINEWRLRLKETVEGGKTLAEVYGQRVLGAVKKIAEAAEWLATHWKTIAYVVAGIKLTGLVMQVGGLTKEVLGLVGALGRFAGIKGIGGVAGFAGKAAGAGAAAGLGYAVGTLFTDIIPKALGAKRGLGEVLGDALAKTPGAADEARQRAESLKAARARWAPGGGGSEAMARAAVPGAAGEPAGIAGLVDPAKPRRGDFINHGPININQKFEEADPDDVYTRFKEDLEDASEKVLMSKLQPVFGG